MSQQIKNKCTRLFLFLFLFTFLFILSPQRAFAEGEPALQTYKMISDIDHININTMEESIGIIVEFDTLEGVTTSSGGIYAELNMIMEGMTNNIPALAYMVDSITINGEKITPNEDELLFQFDYFQGVMFLDVDNHQNQPGDNENEPYLLKLEKIVLNGLDIPVVTEPVENHRVFFDVEAPSFIEGEITSVDDTYLYQDKLTMDLHFDEPVNILDMDQALKFCIYGEDDEKEVINSFTDVTGNGSKDITLSYTFDENLRAEYSGDINLIIDGSLVTDIAGNILWRNGYIDIFHDYNNDGIKDNVVIDSIYPNITEAEALGTSASRIEIEFEDDDTDYSFAHLTNNWEVGIFLSEDKIDDMKNIEYSKYQLLYEHPYNGPKSHLIYSDYDDQYILYITTSDDAFSKSDNKDQEWYFYCYIEDDDGNRIYREVANVYMDKAPPEINFDGEYLIPLANQEIEYKITDSFISDFGFNIKNLNGDSIFNDDENDSDYDGYYREFYFEGFLGIDPLPDYLHVNEFDDEGDYIDLGAIIEGKFNAEEAVNHINANVNNPETHADALLNTGTYELIMFANDDKIPIVSENSMFFTIDKTPPTVAIDTSEGDAASVASYQLTFSDFNGKEVITASNPSLIDDRDSQITLYYDFVKKVEGQTTYPEAEGNQKIVHTGDEVTLTVPYGDLTPGTYYLSVKGVDHAGNIVRKISDDTFVVSDVPVGTIDCDEFSNDLILDAKYTVTSDYADLAYRISVDKKSSDCTIDSKSWKVLNLNGEKSLSINLDESLDQGEYDLYMQYQFTLNGIDFESQIISDSFIYDTEGPIADISYSTDEVTYEAVTASLVNMLDNYTNTDDIEVYVEEIDNSLGTKEVILNTSEDIFTFVIKDKAGNESKYAAQAANLSSDAKTAKVVYSRTAKTIEDITVYLDFETMDNDKANVTLMGNIDPSLVDITLENGMSYFVFKENGNYNFKYIDDLNREGNISAFIHNIDRVAPVGEVSYNIIQVTNKDVYGYIKASENVDYKIYDGFVSNERILDGSISPIETGQSNDGEMIKYLFTENRSLTVLLVDKAGNSNLYNLAVDWIDKTSPSITVDYSDNYSADIDEKTRKDITVTISANEDIYVLNNNQNISRVFTENEDYTFMVEDEAGNHVDVDISIVNIDKSEPEVNFDYNTKKLTNGNVTVTMTPVDNNLSISVLNNSGSNVLEFDKNGKKYFQYKVSGEDDVYIKFIEITNIDKEEPVMKFDEYKDIYVAVGGEIDLDTGFSIFDDVDGTIVVYTIDDNINNNAQGVYYANYTFSDEAGNEVTVERKVEVLSDLTLLVNGMKASDELMMIDGLQLEVEVLNTEGNYEVQYKEGFYKTGKFKKNKQFIRNSIATADRGGYVTIYVQDQERNWKLIRAYLYE